jgi:hypothetical protein
MNGLLCVAGVVVVAALYVLILGLCRAAARADDWAEQHLGIRRS